MRPNFKNKLLWIFSLFLILFSQACTREELTELINSLSDNAYLSNLGLDQGNLNENFSFFKFNYTAKVPFQIQEITFMVSPEESSSTWIIKKNNLRVTQPLALAPGLNSFQILVTAPDQKSTCAYNLDITREEEGTLLSTNADLSLLDVAGFSLSPVFSAQIEQYYLSVPYSTESLTLSYLSADTKASVELIGNPLSLAVGDNTFTLIVTAEAGNKKTYQLTVNRADPILSNNADLMNLSLSQGSLSPSFTPSLTAYEAVVLHETTSVQVFTQSADSKASVAVSGNPGSLFVGDNFISIVVTAEAGNTRTYTLNIKRGAYVPSSNAFLSSLIISEGSLLPGFSQNTLAYSVHVPYETESLVLTATAADLKSTLKLNGTDLVSGVPSNAQTLNIGSTVFNLLVSAEAGNTHIYTVTVNRSGKPLYQLTDFTHIGDTSEGIAFDGDGYMYVTVYNQGKILKIDSSGTPSSFLSNLSGPAGLAPLVGGGFFLCEFGAKKVHKLSAQGTILASYTTISTFKSFSQPNAVAVNSLGTAYVSDTSGFMAYIKADGTKGVLKSFTSEYPNGLTIIEDGANDIIYVNVNSSGLKGKIYKLVVTRATAAVSSSTALTLNGDVLNLADGIVHDALGNLWISHSSYTGSVFTGYKVDTSAMARLNLATNQLTNIYTSKTALKGPANIAFGKGQGFDPKSLYLTQMEDVGVNATPVSKWIKVINVLE